MESEKAVDFEYERFQVKKQTFQPSNLVRVGKKRLICRNASISGEETPIFGIYVLKYPRLGTFTISIARAAIARRANALSMGGAGTLQSACHRAPPLLMRTAPKYDLAGTEDVHHEEFGALKFFSVTDLPIELSKRISFRLYEPSSVNRVAQVKTWILVISMPFVKK